MRTNETLFALTSTVHYQSGEDIVVILCHHPHGLGLEGNGDRGTGRESVNEWSSSHIRLLQNQQHIHNKQYERDTQNELISKRKTSQVLMGILINTWLRPAGKSLP